MENWTNKGLLRGLRAVAVFTMAIVALLGGAPDSTSAASLCEDELIECHSEPDACVVDVNEPCEMEEECFGEVKCGLGSEFGCAEEFAEYCSIPD